MKTNAVLLGGVGAFVASATLAFSLYQGEGTNLKHYEPYQPTDPSEVVELEEEEEKKKSAEGATRYMHMLKANPSTGTYSSADVRKAIDQANQNRNLAKKSAAEFNWSTRGPDNQGGRTRAIIIDNDDNSVLYAGSASGGLFKSTNKGSTWNSVEYEDAGRYKSLAISCMEQASNGTIYFGTGERYFASISALDFGNAGSGGYKGMGMWKSTDGGETWQHLESTIPTDGSGSDAPFGPGESRSPWDGVNEIAIDPDDPQRVFVATQRGLLLTEDGGNSWNELSGQGGDVVNFPADVPYSEVAISDDGQTVFTASRRGLMRSTDGGNSFEPIGDENNFPTSAGRIEVALAPQDNNVVYANVTSDGSENLVGIYRSGDNGDSWTTLASGGGIFDPFTNSVQGQGTWGNAIKVSPYDKNRIFVAGVHFYTYKGQGNGNGQWRKAANSSKYFGSNDQFVDPQYLHVDHHEIRFDTESETPIMYIGNDGGIAKTTNDFRDNLVPNYKDINTGYNTLQFYNFEAVPNGDITGGAQDNGTWKLLKDGLTGNSYRRILGGDGFYTEISELRPNVYFAESQGGSIGRSSDRGGSFNRGLYDNDIPQSQAIFNTPFALYENKNDQLSGDTIVYQASGDTILRKGEIVVAADSLKPSFMQEPSLVQVRDSLFQASSSIIKLPGDQLSIASPSGVEFQVKVDSALLPEETLRVQNPVRALFAIALRNQIWITPDMLNFSTSPTWYKVAGNTPNTPTSIKFSKDGKSLLIGGTSSFSPGSGEVYRIDGIREATYSDNVVDGSESFADANGIESKQVGSFDGTVSSATFDQNDKDRMIVTTGSYGLDNHVYYTDNAMADNPSFRALDAGSGDNSLPEMPVYDAMFKLDENNQVIIGSEMGTWFYDLDQETQGWTEVNNGMPRVPTLTLQQYVSGNEYKAFAGTYGRGIFGIAGQKVGTPDKLSNNDQGYEPSISAYPNPANSYTNLEIDLKEGAQARLQMVSMQGQVVKQQLVRGTASDQQIRINTNSLQSGTYVVRLRGDATNKTTKVVVQ
jgi:hypothetical protein